MYFQSLDSLHIILASLFLLTSLGVVFFRYRKLFLLREKMVNYTTNKNFILIRLMSLIISIICIAITVLGPMGLMQGGSNSKTEGIDCIWLLDVSASMDVADVTENSIQISRITQAKSVIENYIITHPENRYGLVIFAGTSRLVSPLTSEHNSLLTFLASINSKSISEGGTDFRKALSLAVERFETTDKTPHAIVLLSDGGDSEDSPDIDSIADIFHGKHATLTTIGIGKTKPSPIRIGKDPFGETIYKKFNGEIVLSGLNRETLKALSKKGGGSYIEGGSIQKDLENALGTISRHTLSKSGDISNDATTRVFVSISCFFFLVFLLFPSSFLKRGNVL